MEDRSRPRYEPTKAERARTLWNSLKHPERAASLRELQLAPGFKFSDWERLPRAARVKLIGVCR